MTDPRKQPSSGGLLSTTQAAEVLATSTTTMRRMFRDGDLPAVRHRGVLKFRRSDIEAYIEERLVSHEPRERKPRVQPVPKSADMEARYPHLRRA